MLFHVFFGGNMPFGIGGSLLVLEKTAFWSGYKGSQKEDQHLLLSFFCLLGG